MLKVKINIEIVKLDILIVKVSKSHSSLFLLFKVEFSIIYVCLVGRIVCREFFFCCVESVWWDCL